MHTSDNDFVFPPLSASEMVVRGWDQPDIILVTGDAYIDHPSFGAAIMVRLAEKLGMRVAVLAQPNWQDDLRDFRKLGAPRLFFAVTAGSMDSMVNHYTALRRRRSNDAYTPGGRSGYRPDYATVVYSQIVKEMYPDTPVVIGGVEASMRRFTHYDYWQDKLKPSILVEAGADLLLYGMAENAWKKIIELTARGVPFASLKNIEGTGFLVEKDESLRPLKGVREIYLPSHEDCLKDKKVFARAFCIMEESSQAMKGPRLIQETGSRKVVVNPPSQLSTQQETDEPWDLPFTRLPHPRYAKKPPIPAYEMIKFSVNTHRGCFGGCSFCAINMHQGKFVRSRSEGSVLNEVAAITNMPGFKGHITDLGGPSANMYKMRGVDQKLCEKCKRPSCMYPSVCNNLNFDHHPLLRLYENASAVPGVKRITIGSGVRYDLLIGRSARQNKQFGLMPYVQKLLKHHVSGRLKVAPEHTAPHVLTMMRKPDFSKFEQFSQVFREICRKENLPWQLVPYFISGHPGTRESDMKGLAAILKDLGQTAEQVQEFTPTPMTLATTMYYTGIDPWSGKEVAVTKDRDQKRKQKDYFFRHKKKPPQRPR